MVDFVDSDFSPSPRFARRSEKPLFLSRNEMKGGGFHILASLRRSQKWLLSDFLEAAAAAAEVTASIPTMFG